MHIGWPQGLFIALTVFGNISSLAAYAKSTEPNATELGIALLILGDVITYTLLIWGGFFG